MQTDFPVIQWRVINYAGYADNATTLHKNFVIPKEFGKTI